MTTAELNRAGHRSGTSGSDTKQDLKNDADRLADTAKDKASEKTAEYKSQATRTARSASDALEKAAGDLDRDNDAPGWLSSAFRETAKGIDRFAGKVEGRSPEQMGREVTSFARKHPTTFLAASAAAGFAAARFLRAGADHKRHDHETTGSYDANPSYAGRPNGGRFAEKTRAAQNRYAAIREGMTQ